jgi:hypothetical protein
MKLAMKRRLKQKGEHDFARPKRIPISDTLRICSEAFQGQTKGEQSSLSH